MRLPPAPSLVTIIEISFCSLRGLDSELSTHLSSNTKTRSSGSSGSGGVGSSGRLPVAHLGIKRLEGSLGPRRRASSSSTTSTTSSSGAGLTGLTSGSSGGGDGADGGEEEEASRWSVKESGWGFGGDVGEKVKRREREKEGQLSVGKEAEAKHRLTQRRPWAAEERRRDERREERRGHGRGRQRSRPSWRALMARKSSRVVEEGESSS